MKYKLWDFEDRLREEAVDLMVKVPKGTEDYDDVEEYLAPVCVFCGKDVKEFSDPGYERIYSERGICEDCQKAIEKGEESA